MAAIELENVSKRYRLGTSVGSLREAFRRFRLPLFSRRADHQDGRDCLWALKDVSVRVERGEVVGLIGPNGAGKSTMLKLLSSITYPTQGRIRVAGRVSALIEVGAGFHLELTGRENIFLNGSILGMSRREIERKYNSIVEFSELERFIDTPIKRYSSGMYVRLGFSVAAHVDPDVLLVDEVLAVGDVGFRRKCLDKIREVRETGTTILFVTHHSGYLRKLCDRTVVLCDGEIAFDGGTDRALTEYAKALRVSKARVEGWQAYLQNERPDSTTSSSPVVITAVRLLDASGGEVDAIGSGDTFRVRIEYRARHRIETPVFDIGIWTPGGVKCHGANTKESSFNIDSIDGQGWVEIKYDPLALLPGFYEVAVAIEESDGLVPFDVHYRAYPFEVTGAGPEHGIALLDVSWEKGQGTT